MKCARSGEPYRACVCPIVCALQTSTVGGLGPIWAVTWSNLIYKNVQNGRSVSYLLWILAANIDDRIMSLFCVKDLHLLGVTSSAEEGQQCYIDPPCTAVKLCLIMCEQKILRQHLVKRKRIWRKLTIRRRREICRL